jgi:hypothetical protein
MDFILNGQPHGNVAATLLRNNGDVGALRPMLGKDGRSYVTLNVDGKPKCVPLQNANATLRKDDWILLDEAIIKAAKPRLRLVSDLRGRGLQFSIPNGMGKTVLETETQSDINEATVSMDGLRRSIGDRPVFNLTMLPLPIVHKDFAFSMRQIMASRNGGSPLDTTTAELAARRVAELVEQFHLGVTPASAYAYGGGTIYGLTNFPSRNTKVLTAPTVSGWTGSTFVTQVLQMRQQSMADFMFGPWALYTAPNWDTYLDGDFSTAKGDLTLRQRILQIQGIESVQTLDYLTNYDAILVQLTSDVIRTVVGMELTTVQWESEGGMQQNFKVMAILVPQLRADFNGNSGIVHGSV